MRAIGTAVVTAVVAAVFFMLGPTEPRPALGGEPFSRVLPESNRAGYEAWSAPLAPMPDLQEQFKTHLTAGNVSLTRESVAGRAPEAETDYGDALTAGVGKISGIIRDTAGNPIEGARVYVSEQRITHTRYSTVMIPFGDANDTILIELDEVITQSQIAPAASNSQGEYVLAGLGNSRYWVYVVAEEFEPTRLGPIDVGTRSLSVIMQAAATIGITVVDGGTGERLRDATVAAFRHSDVRVAPRALLIRSGDASEMDFLVTGAGSAANVVVATAPGYGPERVEVLGMHPGEHRNIQIGLAPAASLTGNVISVDGEPMTGATVHILPIGQRRTPLYSSLTSPDGSYRFEGLPAMEVDVFASANGWAETASRTVDLKKGEARGNIDFVVHRPGRIFGTLRDVNGVAMSNRHVHLDVEPFDTFKYGELSECCEYRVETKVGGVYAFEGLSAGRYQLSVREGPREIVDLLPSEEREVHLTLVAPAVIRGRITSGPGPVEDVTIMVVGPSARGSARSDADGAYEVRVSVGGRYELFACPPAGPTSRTDTVDVVAGEMRTVDIVLPAGSIAGYIAEDIGEARVEGVEIRLLGGRNSIVASTRSDDKGRYSFGYLPPGEYRVHCTGWANAGEGRSLAFTPCSSETIVSDGERVVDGISLELCRGARIEGLVATATGVPIADRTSVRIVRWQDGMIVPGYEEMRVTAGRETSMVRVEVRGGWWRDHIYTTDGRFAIPALEAGEYRIRIGDHVGADETASLGFVVDVGEHEVREVVVDI